MNPSRRGAHRGEEFCWGRAFRISDGSVATGPAQRPLTAVPIKVVNGMITLA